MKVHEVIEESEWYELISTMMGANMLSAAISLIPTNKRDRKKSTEEILEYLRKHHRSNLHSEFIEHIKSFNYFVLEVVPISSIKTELKALNRDKVEEFKKIDFSTVPPIVMAGGYILDGYRRASVAKALDIPNIQAWVGIQGI